MIIIKNVPGLSTSDVMEAIADQIPLDKIETGHGGIVVDEATALVFLTRYAQAIAGSNQGDTPATPADADEEPTETTTPRRRGGRPRKETTA